MFTTGQITFAICFFIAFVITMVFMYKKDALIHKTNYKGVIWVLIGFLLFFVFLFAVKYFMKE